MKRLFLNFLFFFALGACEADIPEGLFACDTLNDCPSNWFCVDSLCYSVPSGGCIPTACDALGAECGVHPDGCGGVTETCGVCGSTTPYCSAGGQCSATACSALTACPSNACGVLSDGCGGILECGGCNAPFFCGGGGKDNECGCTPVTCESQGIACGEISDGCGGTLNCDQLIGGCGLNAECRDNACICHLDSADQNGGNETESTASPLVVDLSTDQDTTRVDTNNLHKKEDVDWFDVELSEQTQALLKNGRYLEMRIVLSPGTSDYFIAAKASCSSGHDNTPPVCVIGTFDATTGICHGSSADRIVMQLSCTSPSLLVRITAIEWKNTCGNYQLRFATTPGTIIVNN